MFGKARDEIVKGLLMHPAAGKADADPRIDILVEMVFDLLIEVEALREAAVKAGGKDSAYGRAYRDTAYLSHNAAGTSSGLEKVLAQFYPHSSERVPQSWGESRTWRECLMLRRLGYSEGEIAQFKESAEQAEMFT